MAHCMSCGNRLKMAGALKARVMRARALGNTGLKVRCVKCGALKLAYIGSDDDVEETDHRTFRCPVAACIGHVSWVEPGPRSKKRAFWGCGECGSVWYEIENFFAEIGRAVAKYPYRKRCYRKRRGGGWEPGSEPPGTYEERVEAEVPDRSGSYVRG